MGVRRIAIAVRVSVKTVCVSVLVLKLRNCLTKQHQVQLRWRGGGGQTNSLRCDNNCEHKSFDNMCLSIRTKVCCRIVLVNLLTPYAATSWCDATSLWTPSTPQPSSNQIGLEVESVMKSVVRKTLIVVRIVFNVVHCGKQALICPKAPLMYANYHPLGNSLFATW